MFFSFFFTTEHLFPVFLSLLCTNRPPFSLQVSCVTPFQLLTFFIAHLFLHAPSHYLLSESRLSLVHHLLSVHISLLSVPLTSLVHSPTSFDFFLRTLAHFSVGRMFSVGHESDKNRKSVNLKVLIDFT